MNIFIIDDFYKTKIYPEDSIIIILQKYDIQKTIKTIHEINKQININKIICENKKVFNIISKEFKNTHNIEDNYPPGLNYNIYVNNKIEYRFYHLIIAIFIVFIIYSIFLQKDYILIIIILTSVFIFYTIIVYSFSDKEERNINDFKRLSLLL